jgi:hypothetical protein
MTQSTLNNQISDNFFIGLSDSDGSIYGAARLKETKNQTPSFSSSFYFEIEQASYNEGNSLAVMNYTEALQSAYMTRIRQSNTKEPQDYVVVRVNLGCTRSYNHRCNFVTPGGAGGKKM